MLMRGEGRKNKTDEVRFWRGDRERMQDPGGSKKERVWGNNSTE